MLLLKVIYSDGSRKNLTVSFTEPDRKFQDENIFDKFSFDADPFTSDKFPKTKTIGSDGNNNFDPFGAPITGNKKETTSGFGFDTDFDAFANFDAFNDNDTTNGSSEALSAWTGNLDKKNNNARKAKKYNEQEINNITKFSSDNFDKDLEEALKRSMTEQ